MTPDPGPTGPTPTGPGNPRPTQPPRPRTLAADIYDFAHHDRYGRIALAAIWVGLYLITSGTSHLWLELRRHPLTEATS